MMMKLQNKQENNEKFCITNLFLFIIYQAFTLGFVGSEWNNCMILEEFVQLIGKQKNKKKISFIIALCFWFMTRFLSRNFWLLNPLLRIQIIIKRIGK